MAMAMATATATASASATATASATASATATTTATARPMPLGGGGERRRRRWATPAAMMVAFKTAGALDGAQVERRVAPLEPRAVACERGVAGLAWCERRSAQAPHTWLWLWLWPRLRLRLALALRLRLALRLALRLRLRLRLRLGRCHKLSEVRNELSVFNRSYTAVSSPRDITFADPPNAQSK